MTNEHYNDRFRLDPKHVIRTRGSGGPTLRHTTPMYMAQKRAVYDYVQSLEPGERIIFNRIRDATNVSLYIIDRILIRDNFVDGNVCRIIDRGTKHHKFYRMTEQEEREIVHTGINVLRKPMDEVDESKVYVEKLVHISKKDEYKLDKHTVYNTTKKYNSGDRVYVNKISRETEVPYQHVYKMLVHDNFKENNPCELYIDKSKSIVRLFKK